MKLCLNCSTTYTARNWTCPACGLGPTICDPYPVLAPELEESRIAYPADAHSNLARLEDGSFWFRARNHLIEWALRTYFPDMKRYLEIGCGTGFVLAGVARAFPSTELVGSEAFSAGLAIAASRAGRAELVQMDARRIPYVEEFDVVGAFDVLEHIEEDEMVLRQISSALRRSGGIVVTVPQHPWLWSAEDEYARHVRRYHRTELRDKLVRAGFEVMFETSFVSLLLPAMLASRLSRGRVTRDSHLMSELQLPSALNHALEAVMNLERTMIRIGLRFPLGGSRLLVGRKRSQSSQRE